MNAERLRKRGGELGSPKIDRPAPSPPSRLRAHLGRMRRLMIRLRMGAKETRLLCILLSALTLLFGVLCVLLFYLHPSIAFMGSESAKEWMRRHIVCPDTLIDIPPPRPMTKDAGGGGADNVSDRTSTFAFDVGRQNEIPDRPATVAGLDGFCASRVAEVPRWASGSWRQWRNATLKNGAIFNLTMVPNLLANATYTAIGSPFCLADGAMYLPQDRINAGGVGVFGEERMTVLPLSDAVLQNAVASRVSAGLHVVPAMGLLLSGHWISTHFFHLITDTLETLHCAFHTMEDGVLMHVPTQTVMLHTQATDWIDRHGDRARKMEFSAALANGFSSPLLKSGSPYSTSFLFRPDSPYCAGPHGGQRRSANRAAAASAVCFCDGLLITTRSYPFMDAPVYYGIQDWAAQEFGAPPYLERRSVREMARLRLAQSPSWAARFWAEDSTTSVSLDSTASAAAAAATPYRPRVLFIHRTTRLIANAMRYAAWMRDAGFHVEEVYMEQLTAAQQYHLGRYADVVVGMHGLGIGHAMWMEREPQGCRTVIEFRPWVIQAMPLQPFRVLGQTMKFHFMAILPTDVRFGSAVKDPEGERKLLLSMERVNSAFSFPSFTNQTAFYDDAEVRRVIWAVHQHLNRCLPK
ncbi:hypothetical protein ABL78_5939 [Leptomonas seymouri]|uniref:Glycosyltransferase 61 catalytic domain-containing protein n=1 Tax=Leptomonas seymouri TaxID=5684 RepID=A0A0N1PD55_LEPSE|nr:hypothetical protein ABL78_5939 [Leptomonas seymouri]|eukprot:KPI85004.1 hypothetical protein ABL78_5939 [Leptomonas seymouri]